MRRAETSELDVLNKIAFGSESIWGEDENYMMRFSQEYCVTTEMISNEYVYILESNNVLIGFFSIIKSDKKHELELFYIDKSMVGKGYGQKLWYEMINLCKTNGITKIELVASKDVAKFYCKMGAIEIERIKSRLKTGRIVSVMEYEIT